MVESQEVAKLARGRRKPSEQGQADWLDGQGPEKVNAVKAGDCRHA